MQNYSDILMCKENANLPFESEIEAFNKAVNDERNAKIAQLPSKENYMKAHPNATVDDYVAYTKTDALKKEYDSLCSDEFMKPSWQLIAMRDTVCTQDTFTHAVLASVNNKSANTANSKK